MSSVCDTFVAAAGGTVGVQTFRCIVPLSKIWPMVSKSFEHDAVYVGMG